MADPKPIADQDVRDRATQILATVLARLDKQMRGAKRADREVYLDDFLAQVENEAGRLQNEAAGRFNVYSIADARKGLSPQRADERREGLMEAADMLMEACPLAPRLNGRMF